MVSLILVSLVVAEDSFVISKIHVDTKNVFDDAVTHTSFERELYRLGNWFHIETKPSVIRGKLSFNEGDTISFSEIQDAEKNLRALRYISDAKIEAKKDSLGNIDIYVETSDNWTFAPAFHLGKPGEKWLWAFGVQESNLLGFGHTIGFYSAHLQDRDQKYLLYQTDDFIFPHNKLDFLWSENTDGFSRSLGLRYPFISRSKNQWSYNAEWLWSKRDEKFYESENSEPAWMIEGLSEDSLSLWLSRSFGGTFFKTYLGAGYDFYRIGRGPVSKGCAMGDTYQDSRLGFSLAMSRVHLDKKRNFHRVKWTEDIERGYKVKNVIAKNVEDWGAINDDWYFENSISLSLGAGGHNFYAKGHNSFYYNDNNSSNDNIRHMNSILFGEYIFKPVLEWSSVLSARVDSWQKTYYPRQLYLDGLNIFPGFPAYYLAGQNTFAFKAEQRYFPGFEVLAQIPSFAMFVTAGQATDELRAFEPRDLIYQAGLGLRVSNSKSVQGIVSHINLSWPLNGNLKDGFLPRFSFVGKLEL
ncbi:MAG: hypothetical protein LBU89_14195 [Fibromonadaceae bacterium]|nr:hypothetical protein [Fibromonadaceae bacterium]